MTNIKDTAERWAQRWLSIIEMRGNIALSPEDETVSFESKLPITKYSSEILPQTRRSRPSEAANVDGLTRDEINSIEYDYNTRITGTRVVMVEDRAHLEHEVNLIRPAFDSLSTHIRACVQASESRELLFGKLGELIVAAYYIGAYTTVSDGTQEFVIPAVTPKVLENKLKNAQKSKRMKDSEKRELLRAAIIKVSGRRELKGSTDFAEQIHPKVAAELRSKLDEWPSAKTIKTAIQLMNQERRRAKK